MGSITDLDNVLDGFSSKLLLVGLRVDFLEESTAFFFDVESVGEGEESVLVEAAWLFLVSQSIGTNNRLRDYQEH